MADIEQFVRDLNKAWRDRRYEDLYEYFHDEVVMLPPGTGAPVVGIEPMVQSYRQFGSVGKIHEFNIKALTVYDYGAVSICHMRFEVDYEMESGRFREEGLEVYAIDTSSAEPRVVWRTQMEADKPSFLCGVPMLRVSNVETAVEHYRSALGFDVAWVRSDGIASVGRGKLNLLLADHNAAPGGWVYAHLASRPEVKALHRRYRESGVKIVEPPGDRPWGLFEMRVEDLDGNVIRIACNTEESHF